MDNLYQQGENFETSKEDAQSIHTSGSAMVNETPGKVIEQKSKLKNRLSIFKTKIIKFLKSPLGKVIILIVVFFFFAAPIFLIFLGFDKIFIRSHLQGVVVSIDDEVIPNASVKIQGKEAETDENGEFIIKDLDYGKWEILITANGYSEFSEQIVLQRFSNDQEFKLYPQDFGEVEGKLSTQELKLESLELFINDKKLEIAEDGVFKTGRLISGSYILKLTSPYYKDLEKEIEIKSGSHTLEDISIAPAGDLKWQIVDFLNDSFVKDSKIEFSDKNYEVEEIEDSFLVRDLEVGNTYKLNIEKEGYNKKEVESTIVQGENSLEKVKLAREGRISYFRNGNVYNANLDGSSEILLSDGLLGCKYQGEDSNGIYLKCFNTAYYIGKLNANRSTLFTGLGELDKYTPGIGLIKAGDGLNIITEGESVELYSGVENVISWVLSEDRKVIYFSTSSSVYKVNVDGASDSEKITDGEFYIQDISENKLLAINYSSAARQENNIWFIFSDGTKERVTVVPEVFEKVQYIPGNKLLYLKSSGASKSLYIKDLNTTNETHLNNNVADYIYTKSQQLITSGMGSEVFVSTLSGKTIKIK